MSITSKSPAAVLRAAMQVAKQALPAYSHRCSPKKFTQHQLFACLVLKNFLKADYRGVTVQLQDCPSLQKVLGLGHVPHYTTLQKAARRLLLSDPAKKLLDATVREQLGRRQRVTVIRLHRHGMHRGQRLLCASSRERGWALEKHGLSSFSQTGRNL